MNQVRLGHRYRAYIRTESLAGQRHMGLGGQGIGVRGVQGSKVTVLIVTECKRASMTSVYELIFLPYTSRSTEYY